MPLHNSVSLTIVTNLYPTQEKPYFGTFVRQSAEAISEICKNVNVISLTQFGTGPSGYIKFYWRAFKETLKCDDIIYVHYVSHSSIPILLSKFFNRKLIIILHFHGSDAFPELYEGRLRKYIKYVICKLAISKSNKIVVPSEYFKNKMMSKFKLASPPIVSPSGGVDDAVFYRPITKKSAIDGKLRILFASRMIDGKGSEFAAKLALEIAQLFDNIEFNFIGSGDRYICTKQILLPLIKNGQCYLGESVSQLELANYFKESDIFLFPSTREGESLGLVLVEAMSCGAVPIAFNNGACSEILSQELIANTEEEFKLILVRVINEIHMKDTKHETYFNNISKSFGKLSVAKKLINDITSD